MGKKAAALKWLSLRHFLNAYQTCRYESNDCYPCWMYSVRASYEYALQMVTKTQHAAVEHRGVHCKQDQGHPAATLQKQGTRHRPSGDPLRYHRKASDSQLLTSFSELHPCTTREERDTQDGGTARPQGSSTRRCPTCGKSGPFTPEELVNALKHIEPGK